MGGEAAWLGGGTQGHPAPRRDLASSVHPFCPDTSPPGQSTGEGVTGLL